MIAAVDPSSDRFGGLEGYLARAVRPSGVPSRPPDFANGAGAKTRPGADVPTPPQPFKTSGATPGKKSNECIPYARVVPLNSYYHAAKPGHVSFVSATGAMPLGRPLDVCGAAERVRARRRDKRDVPGLGGVVVRVERHNARIRDALV